MARFDCRCVEDARRAESFDLVNGALARAKNLAEIRVCEPMGERGRSRTVAISTSEGVKDEKARQRGRGFIE